MKEIMNSAIILMSLFTVFLAAGCTAQQQLSPDSSIGKTSAFNRTQSSTAWMTTTKSVSSLPSMTTSAAASHQATTTSTHRKTYTSPAVKLTTTAKETDMNTFFNDSVFKKGKDAYGSKSINILGDSISHGANAPQIPNDSLIGLLKKSIAKKYGAYNYGYTSMLFSFDNPSGDYHELHTVTQSKGQWGIGTGEGAGGHLGFQFYKSLSKDGELIFSIDRNQSEAAKRVKGVYVYYQAGPDQGAFQVQAGGKVLETINCWRDKTDTCARSSYIPLPSLKGNKVDIQVIKSENSLPITITGMAYAENPNMPTIQNYSRSGLQLIEVSNDVLRSVCQANVLIFALGFNDAGLQADPVKFKNKINYVIRSCEASGAKVVVLDTIWSFNSTKEYYRSELKRLAVETGGEYISFTDMYADNPSMIQDGAHPSVQGHHQIAQRICKRLGIPEVN